MECLHDAIGFAWADSGPVTTHKDADRKRNSVMRVALGEWRRSSTPRRHPGIRFPLIRSGRADKWAGNSRLFMFLGLFGDFLTGMRHVLADTGDGVARAQERRGPEQDDETGESDCKVLAHDTTPPCFGASLSRLRR